MAHGITHHPTLWPPAPGGATRRGLAQAGVAAAGAAAAGAACGPLGPGGAAPAASRQPLTLRWGFYAGQPLTDTVAKALPAFTARYPQITLVQERTTQSGLDYIAQLAAGSAPDVFAACCYALPVWAAQGLLAALDPLLKRDGKEIPLSDYAPTLMQYWNTPERGQFALPMSAYTRGLYYNRTLFRRKGVPFPDATWDWNRFRDAMVQLNEPDQKRWGWQVVVDYERTGHYIRQNGGLQVDPKDNGKAVFDSPQALAALQWLHDRMWKDGALLKPADYATAAVGAQPVVALARGTIAIVTDGAWKIPQLMTEAPTEADQWDLAVLPKGPAQRVTHASTDGWSIPAGSKEKDGAWILMRFLQSDAWLEPAIAIAGHQPARKSWLDRYAVLMKQAYPALADKNIASLTEGYKQDYAFPLQLFRRHLDSTKLYDETVAAVFGRNERPVADAFRDAARSIIALNAAS